MPPNMADWLAADHLVWFVLDVVEQLDTTALHSQRRTGGVGRAGYDPDMLLALMIYAYATGQRSSRRIEQLCRPCRLPGGVPRIPGSLDDRPVPSGP